MDKKYRKMVAKTTERMAQALSMVLSFMVGLLFVLLVCDHRWATPVSVVALASLVSIIVLMIISMNYDRDIYNGADKDKKD